MKSTAQSVVTMLTLIFFIFPLLSAVMASIPSFSIPTNSTITTSIAGIPCIALGPSGESFCSRSSLTTDSTTLSTTSSLGQATITPTTTTGGTLTSSHTTSVASPSSTAAVVTIVISTTNTQTGPGVVATSVVVSWVTYTNAAGISTSRPVPVSTSTMTNKIEPITISSTSTITLHLSTSSEPATATIIVTTTKSSEAFKQMRPPRILGLMMAILPVAKAHTHTDILPTKSIIPCAVPLLGMQGCNTIVPSSYPSWVSVPSNPDVATLQPTIATVFTSVTVSSPAESLITNTPALSTTCSKLRSYPCFVDGHLTWCGPTNCFTTVAPAPLGNSNVFATSTANVFNLANTYTSTVTSSQTIPTSVETRPTLTMTNGGARSVKVPSIFVLVPRLFTFFSPASANESSIDLHSLISSVMIPDPPLCTWNAINGTYDCPIPDPPLCTWNPVNGTYDCPSLTTGEFSTLADTFELPMIRKEDDVVTPSIPPLHPCDFAHPDTLPSCFGLPPSNTAVPSTLPLTPVSHSSAHSLRVPRTILLLANFVERIRGSLASGSSRIIPPPLAVCSFGQNSSGCSESTRISTSFVTVLPIPLPSALSTSQVPTPTDAVNCTDSTDATSPTDVVSSCATATATTYLSPQAFAIVTGFPTGVILTVVYHAFKRGVTAFWYNV